jgi:hypothetical protein
MSKNPLLNALFATLYVVLVSSVMFYGSKTRPGPDSILAPIAILSLFSLSAVMMAYIFMYQSFQLYFDGKKKEALDLFLKTIAYFAIVTIIALFLLFSGILESLSVVNFLNLK